MSLETFKRAIRIKLSFVNSLATHYIHIRSIRNKSPSVASCKSNKLLMHGNRPTGMTFCSYDGLWFLRDVRWSLCNMKTMMFWIRSSDSSLWLSDHSMIVWSIGASDEVEKRAHLEKWAPYNIWWVRDLCNIRWAWGIVSPRWERWGK